MTINNVVPDTTKPSVTITAPLTGTTISGTYTVSVNAVDASGISKVEFKVDNGSVVSTDNTAAYSYDLNTKNYSNGAHTITVIAYDKAPTPNQQSATVSFTIDNSAPAPPASVGDFNNDGRVGSVDLAVLLGSYGDTVASPYVSGDCNGDGRVGSIDLAMLLGRYGR